MWVGSTSSFFFLLYFLVTVFHFSLCGACLIYEACLAHIMPMHMKINLTEGRTTLWYILCAPLLPTPVFFILFPFPLSPHCILPSCSALWTIACAQGQLVFIAKFDINFRNWQTFLCSTTGRGRGAGSRQQGVYGQKLRTSGCLFFLLLLPFLPPRFPISSRNHLFLLLYCEGSGRVMDRREAGGQGDSLFLLCDLLLLCHRHRHRRRRVLC